jgi:hypothetical protein
MAGILTLLKTNDDSGQVALKRGGSVPLPPQTTITAYDKGHQTHHL